MYTFKVVIHPNNIQTTKLKLIMNKCIECQNIVYDYLDNLLTLSKEAKDKTGEYIPFPKCGEVRRWFTLQKKIKDDEVIKLRIGLTKKEQLEKHLYFLFSDCTNDALKQTVKDTYASFIRFLKGISKYPVRKKYNSKHKSFYIDPYKIKFSESRVKLEKIANNTKKKNMKLNYIKLSEKNRIPIDCNYYNPRVSYDGYRFYLTVGVSDEYAPKKYIEKKNNLSKTIDSIGIDVNINSIVTATIEHELKTYDTFINDSRYNQLTKRLKREQKALSRKYELSKKKNGKFIKSKNFIKNKKRINKLYFKLSCIKEESRNNIINDILINNSPKQIVIEDLDITSMHDNKRLSPFIQAISFYKFLNKVKEKCNFYNIRLIKANRYFPSSKMCSYCKNIKEDLELNNRIYKCDKCGLVIGRDINAAINLARYRNKE